LIILSVSILAACSSRPGFVVIRQGEDSGFNGNLNTGARNKDGRLYTGFSPMSSFLEIQKKAPPTEGNRNLAKNIEGINSVLREKRLSVEILWAGLKKPLKFEVPLESDTRVQSDFVNDLSGQRSNISLTASCEDVICDVVNAVMEDDLGNQAAFTVRKEKRTLRMKIPESQRQNIQSLSTEKQKIIKKSEQGSEVNVTSTEIFPGKSSFAISLDESELNIIRGELVSTNDGSAEISTSGEFSELGTGKMVGNNNEGELIFKFSQNISPIETAKTSVVAAAPSHTDKKVLPLPTKKEVAPPKTATQEVVSYMVLEPRGNKDAMVAKIAAEINAAAEESKLDHPLLRQILADRDRPELKAYIEKNIVREAKDKSGASVQKTGFFYPTVKKYIGCHRGDIKECGLDKNGTDRVKKVKKMSEILEKEDLPVAMTMVSLIESDFNSNATSAVGAAGLWQFMPETAIQYGLKVNLPKKIDERRDLDKSTKAAAKMLKELMISWKGDLKMALASYNAGEGRMRSLCNRKTDSKNCAPGNRKVEFSEMNDLLEISNHDFWKFYQRNFLPKQTQSYVMKFLSGNIIALYPQNYGFGDQPLNLN
jgi:hypothetical protein